MNDPLDDVAWPLRTERMSLRRVRDADLEHTWRYRRLPEVGEYIGWWTDSFEEYRERQWHDDRRRMMLTIELTDGTIIGDIMLKIEDGWSQNGTGDAARASQAELGWNLDPAFGGRGLATEAVRAVITLCFEQLGLRRVHAGCFAVNTPSRRLMERLGMRQEEFSRQTGLHRSGVWMDGMDYALLADEWPSAPAASTPAESA